MSLKMETVFALVVVCRLLFSNIVTYADNFNNCSPGLCSDPPTHDTSEHCSCRPDCYIYMECCSVMINKSTSNHKHSYPSLYYSCRTFGKRYDRKTLTVDRLTMMLRKEFILWNLLYGCDSISDVSFENITNYLKKEMCWADVRPPEDLKKYLYSCIPFISSCPQDSNKEQTVACESEPMALIYVNRVFYKNNDCAKCNGVLAPCNQFYTTFEPSKFIPALTILFYYNTNSFMVTNEQTSTNRIGVLRTSCPKDAVYDINTNQCRQVIYHPPLNCTTTRLNESEYYITSDGRLYLNNTQRFLNQSEFTRDSQGIISICGNNDTNNISNINGISKYSVAESYITLVGLVISIPALAISIIVYLCIPDLRSLPGKLLISLLSALFVAELLFLISSRVTKSTVLCTSLAAVMHYSFLATFFWMNVMSFDAWYTFSGLTQIRSKGKNTKRFVFCSLYAWICPLVIVTVSQIFEYIPGNLGLSPDVYPHR
ncbi:uncharacterized protein LOC118765232 [Octopus sinensis]|uniref:Uncharacterized protein LOC118765232 n=1 Tax=Octopus sinensis TaxID=2607531 RepID=A0A7E6F6B7_9MOLL|nr:uncharacterized protein LOC118765232 [Octopus sinensis]